MTVNTYVNDMAIAARRADLNPAHPPVTRLPRHEAAVRAVVATTVGAASACWENLAGAGVFESTRALQVVEAAVAQILDTTMLGEPSLGCASTADLRAELASRDRDPKSAADDYRTVGSEVSA